MAQGQEHGVDHAHGQSHDLVAGDGHQGADQSVIGSGLGDQHADEGAAGDQDDGDQDGQEGGKGAGQILILDQQIVHVVGVGLLDLSGDLGHGGDPLLGGPALQDEPGGKEGDDGHHDAPGDHQAQVGRQGHGHGQDAGRGGNHGVGQVQAGLGEGGHGGHGDVLALAQNVCDVGAQDGGDITEHGDGHHVGSQGRSQLQVLALEELDEEVGDGLGGAGVLHAHGQHGAQDDGHTQAAQGAAEAGGDHVQGVHEGIPLGPEDAEDDAEGQGHHEQRHHGIQLDLCHQQHQYDDGDDKEDQESNCRHLLILSFPM